jgi:hypothetical protein
MHAEFVQLVGSEANEVATQDHKTTVSITHSVGPIWWLGKTDSLAVHTCVTQLDSAHPDALSGLCSPMLDDGVGDYNTQVSHQSNGLPNMSRTHCIYASYNHACCLVAGHA